MKLVVGLGNPGEKYIGVRHNLGFMVLDKLVDRLQVTGNSWIENKKLKSLICNLHTSPSGLKTVNCNLIVAKPQTYMNNSGMAVKLLSTAYSLQSTDIIIIHDELDLPLGKIKVRAGGAAAGHHGVESIIKSLGTDKFIRVRLGIGNLKIHNPEKFVLEPFTHSEGSALKHMIKQALRALDELLNKGLEYAQNQFN